MPNHPLPPYPGNNWRDWALRMVEFIGRPQPRSTETLPEAILLAHRRDGDRATTPGIMMYDPVLGMPVFSRDGTWHNTATAATEAELRDMITALTARVEALEGGP